MIQSKNYDDKICTLLDGLGVPVEEGRTVTDTYNDTWLITGGRAPKHGHSTGHVWVRHTVECFDRTFYVGVLGLSWSAGEEP